MTTYKIQSGDTLSGIAKKYNTTVDAIAEANGIKNKNLIYTGNTLTIPSASSAGEITVTNKLPVIGYKTGEEKNDTGSQAVTTPTLAMKAAENPPKPQIGTKSAAADIEKWQNSRPVRPSSTYADEIRDLVSAVTGMDFSYDPETDLAYNLIRDEYRKNARIAMEDTLGKALAMTGGYSNSYAQGAAQQAYSDELSRAVEYIPELYSAAYDRFDSDRDALSESIELLADLDGAEFDKYIALMNQYLSEGKMLFDNYEWESEEEFDRFLDYADLLHKITQQK